LHITLTNPNLTPSPPCSYLIEHILYLHEEEMDEGEPSPESNRTLRADEGGGGQEEKKCCN
jgi:hypothetical protein